MTTMLEKLATTLCGTSCACRDSGIVPVFERCTRRVDAVRAVLQEMLEPTAEMLQDGAGYASNDSEAAARLCWQSMLLVILSEKPE